MVVLRLACPAVVGKPGYAPSLPSVLSFSSSTPGVGDKTLLLVTPENVIV